MANAHSTGCLSLRVVSFSGSGVARGWSKGDWWVSIGLFSSTGRVFASGAASGWWSSGLWTLMAKSRLDLRNSLASPSVFCTFARSCDSWGVKESYHMANGQHVCLSVSSKLVSCLLLYLLTDSAGELICHLDSLITHQFSKMNDFFLHSY